MADEADFFTVPPADQADEAPIILGDAPPPPADMGFAGGVAADGGDFGGFAAAGEDEAPPAAEDAAPIVLGAAETISDEEGEGAAPPAESTGPSPMQIWNDEWQETLKARKEEENARKAELVEASRVAMEAFHAERDAKRQAKMTKNREDEQAKLEAIEADLENDNSWQRVCKMVELSHDSTAAAADVKRMRDVLILLKNEPARADALGA